VTVAGAGDFRQALHPIAASGRKLISRGDESGTHQRERALWKASGIADDSSFIVAARAGMAETLSVASRQGAFTLSDRGTLLVKRGGLDLAIVFQGDDEPRNVYAVLEPAAREGVSSEGRGRWRTSFGPRKGAP
jgi:tungstate transport system substrate-binding protein